MVVLEIRGLTVTLENGVWASEYEPLTERVRAVANDVVDLDADYDPDQDVRLARQVLAEMGGKFLEIRSPKFALPKGEVDF